MKTRREWLGMTLGAAGALTIAPHLVKAQNNVSSQTLITRAIPSTGENYQSLDSVVQQPLHKLHATKITKP